jgi:hypothetical protein
MKKRFLPEMLAGLLAIGAVAGISKKERVGEKLEVDEKEVGKSGREEEKKREEKKPEQDPVFCRAHPIEAELRSHHVSIEKMHKAFFEVAELIRSHRYRDPKNEEKYFAVCRDDVRWEGIQKSIAYASQKTGVPERVLVAIGLMESQFQEDIERSDTHVYGPYQMTLATAKEAAKDAQECFGFPISVKSGEDLKETKTAVRLAALRLRSLTKQYGQLGLAIVDYAGGRVGLEKKIKEAFPNVDLGEKNWTAMGRHHLAERQAQKLRDEILKRMKQGRVTDRDRAALRHVIGQFEAAGVAYTKAKKTWQEKRTNLPKTLADAGVNVLALYEHEKAKGGEVPHSITYPLALDEMAEMAENVVSE